MSNRHLVGLGALVLVVAAALWYVSVAPSSGRAIEPGGSGIQVSAVQAGTGAWVRYLVTVTNFGQVDFEGDVLLANRWDDQLPPDSQGLPNFSRVSRLPAIPSQTPDAAYQVHVKLPAGKQRALSMASPDRYALIEVMDHGGQLVASGPVDAATSTPIAVLSQSVTSADQIAAVQIGEFPVRVAALRDPRGLPTSAAQLNAFAAVVLEGFDSAALSRAQQVALRDFVGLGGTVVVAAGPDWRRTLAGLPPELLPLRPRSTATAPLQPVADLARQQTDLEAPVAVGDLQPGARIVLTAGSIPLVVESDYGSGRVVMLTFDPAAEPVGSSRLAALAWTQAVSRGLSKGITSTPSAIAIPGPEPLPASLFAPVPDPPLPSPVVVGAILLAYVLVVGPLNLVLSRRYRKPDLLWVTTPLIAVLCTGSFWAVGNLLQGGNRDQEVQVLKVAPAGTVADLEYHRILFHQRGTHTLTIPEGALAAPLTLSLFQTTGSECTQCTRQLSGLPRDVLEHVVNTVPPEIVETGVAYGNVRMIGTVAVQRLDAGVEAHLRTSGGSITGTLRNLGSSTIRQLSLYSFDGDVLHRTQLAVALAPGGTLQVSGQPKPAEVPDSPRSAPTTSREQLLANALARNSIERDGLPLLLGTIDPQRSQLLVDGARQASTGLGFLEQAVRLEALDSLLPDFQQAHLASRAGDPKSGYVDVYDVRLPPQIDTAVTIEFDKDHHSGIEVYNWATGAWREGPWADAPLNSTWLTGRIQPEEIRAGTVRLRVREARTSWAAFIKLGGPRAAGGL